MKTVGKLKNIFKQIDEAKNPIQIEALGVEVVSILEQNAQKPIEGITDFLWERANILKQKVEFVAKPIEIGFFYLPPIFPRIFALHFKN